MSLNLLRRVRPPVGTDVEVTSIGPVTERETPAYERRPRQLAPIHNGDGSITYPVPSGPGYVVSTPIAPAPAEDWPPDRWHHVAPTIPGWYWMRLHCAFNRETNWQHARVVHLSASANGLVIDGRGGRLARCAPCDWAGPLQPPRDL